MGTRRFEDLMIEASRSSLIVEICMAEGRAQTLRQPKTTSYGVLRFFHVFHVFHILSSSFTALSVFFGPFRTLRADITDALDTCERSLRNSQIETRNCETTMFLFESTNRYEASGTTTWSRRRNHFLDFTLWPTAPCWISFQTATSR